MSSFSTRETIIMRDALQSTLSPSPKNVLQEYYQKLASILRCSIDFPKYNSKRCGGDEHTPIWISTVTLYDGKAYKGEKCNSRKKSEISSAKVALVSLNAIKKVLHPLPPSVSTPLNNSNLYPVTQQTATFPQTVDHYVDTLKNVVKTKTKVFVKTNTNNRYLVLIDVENQPTAINHYIKNYKRDNADLIAFLSIGHHLKYRIDTKNSRIKVVEIPSTRKNSADVGLIIYLTNFLLSQKNTYKKIILVSSDKFVAALAEIINNSSKMGVELGSNIGMISTRTMIECVDILKTSL